MIKRDALLLFFETRFFKFCLSSFTLILTPNLKSYIGHLKSDIKRNPVLRKTILLPAGIGIFFG